MNRSAMYAIQSLLVTILFLAFGSLVAGQESEKPPISDAEIAARIDAWAGPLVEAGHLSGTLLVAQDDQVLYEKSWGFADREAGRRFTPETPCCIASVTKPLTVVMVASALEQDLISLDDPVSRWIADWPDAERITVQHLLYHRSGIRHRLTTPEQEKSPLAPADVVALARQTELDFPPGSQRQYSSGGFTVLVRLLELAEGRSYAQLLEDRIVKPLGLTHTFHPGPGTSLDSAALSYAWTATGQQRSTSMDYSFLAGAGSLFSTPRDMWQVARALINGEFPDRAQRNLLRGGKLRWNGITNNYRAFLEFDSATGVTVALVANQMTGANDLIRQMVPRIVSGEEVPLPNVPQPTPVALTTDALQRFTGRYQIAGSPMPIQARDGALFANDWILIPVSETEFFSPQDYGTIRFLEEAGQPVALDWSGARFDRIGDLADETDK